MQVDSISEQLFFTTVRIDTISAMNAPGSGTGFLFTYKYPDGQTIAPFIVTNKHVVNTPQGKITFIAGKDGKPVLGEGHSLALTDWDQAWFGHPTPEIDIAVCPFLPLQQVMTQQFGHEIFYRCIGMDALPTPEQMADIDALESVTFIGYPNGIWDKHNLLPIARRGTTATPIAVDFEKTPRFIIDASVFGGSSGSPVFIVNQGTITGRTGNVQIGSRAMFVGVVAAVFYRTALNEIVSVPVPTQHVPMAKQQEMLDLGIVFKAHTVVEAIEACLRAKGELT